MIGSMEGVRVMGVLQSMRFGDSHLRTARLAAVALMLVMSAANSQKLLAQQNIGPQFEMRGLRPEQSEIDDMLSKSFGCQSQIGIKMMLDAGLKVRRCGMADRFQSIFARELAQGKALPEFVRQHHGQCTMSTTGELSCAIEREVFSRSSMADPFGPPTHVFEARTIFTIKIFVAPDKPESLKVDLIREDYFGSQNRG